MRITAASALLAGLALSGAPGAFAATVRVPTDHPTIQAAINATDGDDTVVVADGIWTGAGNYDLTLPDTTIVIRSLHGPAVTVIDCEGPDFLDHRAFNLGDGSIGSGRHYEATIIGFTIRNGIATTGGAISGSQWNLNLRYCIFETNRAVYGGAIYCESCQVEIDTCRFNYNLANLSGGAIYGPDSGSVATTHFEYNSAETGGAMADFQRLAIDDCTFDRNVAQYGSALRPLPGDSVWFTLTRTVVSRNQGDAALFMIYGSAQISHCTFYGNNGAIALTGGSPTLTDCILADNRGKMVVCYDPIVGRSSDPFLTYCCVSDTNLDLAGCAASFFTMPNNLIANPKFCDTASDDFRLQATSPCVAIASDGGDIGAEGIGCVPLDIDDGDSDSDPRLPQSIVLMQNYPNPFNIETAISYSLPRACFIRLTVYDLLGREVRTLVESQQSAGPHVILWNGCDNSGSDVASGVYFYRLESDDFIDKKKMLLLK